MPKAKQEGVPAFRLKYDICRNLLGKPGYLEFVEYVLKSYPPTKTLSQERILTLADSFAEGETHKPTTSTGPRLVWEALPYALDCDHTVTGVMLMNASTIERFIQYLPTDLQVRARQILHGDVELTPEQSSRLARPETASVSLNICDHRFAMRIRHTGVIETVGSEVRKHKAIDIRHHYLDPDTANAWTSLVGSGAAYPVYEECRLALNALVESEPWRKALAITEPNTVAMLAGGGAPTKDCVLMNSLLMHIDRNRMIHYSLMDTSPFMLIQTACWMCDHAQANVSQFERIDLDLTYGNILGLDDEDRRFFHRHGKALFGMTGVTIGNMSEKAFFESLDRASESGDLFFMSAETISDDLSDEKAVIDKYDNPNMRRFIEPVVSSVVRASNSGESVEHALSRKKTRLLPVGPKSGSNINGSRSVIISLEVPGQEVTLVKSTRYNEAELNAYADAFDWEPIAAVSPSGIKSHLKQFLFRKR